MSYENQKQAAYAQAIGQEVRTAVDDGPSYLGEFISQIHQHRNSIMDLRHGLGQKADKIFGPRPEAVAKDPSGGILGDSLLSGLGSALDRLRYELDLAHSEFSRFNGL